jgi:hypothetical protein
MTLNNRYELSKTISNAIIAKTVPIICGIKLYKEDIYPLAVATCVPKAELTVISGSNPIKNESIEKMIFKNKDIII